MNETGVDLGPGTDQKTSMRMDRNQHIRQTIHESGDS